MPKLKLVVKKVRVDKAKPANFKGLVQPLEAGTTQMGRTGHDGTNPDPVPNPPVARKMITATASHVLAILIKVQQT